MRSGRYADAGRGVNVLSKLFDAHNTSWERCKVTALESKLYRKGTFKNLSLLLTQYPPAHIFSLISVFALLTENSLGSLQSTYKFGRSAAID